MYYDKIIIVFSAHWLVAIRTYSGKISKRDSGDKETCVTIIQV